MICSRRTAALALLISGASQAQALERPELLPSADTYARITQAEQLWTEFADAFGNRMRADEKVQDFLNAFGENEISLNHLTSFLHNTYYYMEAVPSGIHHRIIFETDQTQGAL